jgi:3-hydroxymyristoyl/3-hydroxydecanoyl-(acyl carrier protein) dehydratase/acyl-CoA thioesterase FadM
MNFPTVAMESKTLKFYFLERIQSQQIDVETIARCYLNFENHPYLLDHNYKGAMILPTVFGLEAMAQAVLATLSPKGRNEIFQNKIPWIIENIKLTRPIPVGPKGIEIEIYAEVLESLPGSTETRITCGIRCATTGFAHDHFKAEFVINNSSTHLKGQQIIPIPLPKGGDGHYITQDIGIRPLEVLYGSILFQGPRFQRIKNIYYLQSDNESHGKTVLFSHSDPDAEPAFILGDPYFRDSLLQSAQLIIPQNQCLPIEIARIEIFPQPSSLTPKLIVTEVNKCSAKAYLAEIEVLDGQGNLLQRLNGYRLQFLEKKTNLPKAMDLIPAMKPTVMQPPAQNHATPHLRQKDHLIAPYQGPFELLRIDAEAGGPQDQSVFIHRFIPDFKTFANLGSGIYFSHIFNWMGLAREMSSIPVLREIRELTESGKWGQVTNWASIEILGECRNVHRIVEARMWCGKLSGSKNSSATLSFDWVSRGVQGVEERIARGQMGFTWVEILAHGVVQPAPLPKSYYDFIKSMEAKNDLPNVYQSVPEPYKNLNPGRSILKTSGGPRSVIPLATKSFETTTFDGNLVGNIYFGNYSIWMGRVRDSFFYRLSPRNFIKSDNVFELLCTKSRIQHLREAMPFDEIFVTMGLLQVNQCGIDLHFEFYRKNLNGMMEKLAIADHQCVWTHRMASGHISAHEWPEEMLQGILQAAKGKIISQDLNAG